MLLPPFDLRVPSLPGTSPDVPSFLMISSNFSVDEISFSEAIVTYHYRFHGIVAEWHILTQPARFVKLFLNFHNLSSRLLLKLRAPSCGEYARCSVQFPFCLILEAAIVYHDP